MPGQDHMPCTHYANSSIDSVVTMRTYWHKSRSLVEFQTRVHRAVRSLGRKYAVGIDRAFGTEDPDDPTRTTTNQSLLILRQALGYVADQDIGAIAVWGTKHVNALFMNATAKWRDHTLL